MYKYRSTCINTGLPRRLQAYCLTRIGIECVSFRVAMLILQVTKLKAIPVQINSKHIRSPSKAVARITPGPVLRRGPRVGLHRNQVIGGV